MNLQDEYRSTYARLGTLKRIGRDLDGDTETDELRTRLFRLWLQMSKADREPFLAPMCLNRIAEGPVDRMFASISPREKRLHLERHKREQERLRTGNFNLTRPKDLQKQRNKKKRSRKSPEPLTTRGVT